MEDKKKRAEHFGTMLVPTLLYAFFFTLFLYENYCSYTMPLFVIATTIYCRYCMTCLGVSVKKESAFYVTGMFLLGVSSFLTGNGFIIFCNTVGIALLLVCMLLHNFCDDTGWGFGKYVHSIFCAVFGSVACIGDFFSDAGCYQKQEKEKKNSAILYVVIGIAISIPILLVVVLLLSSADAVFDQFVQNIRWDFGEIVGVCIMFLFGAFAAYCGFRYLGKGNLKQEGAAPRQYDPIVAVTILTLLSIVYIFFCIIQVLYLFLGKMQLPQGYTYAEYAREGFFQLLFVCLLNLVIVLVILGHFPRKPVLALLLTIISCCTYIMVASSAFRMTLYVQNYQLSFLRLLVFWTLAVIALFLAGVLIMIYKPDFPLFRYGLVVFSVCYLLLSFGRPDYWIASYNLSEAAAEPDYWYVSILSTDAAPAIAHYVETHEISEDDSGWLTDYAAYVASYSEESLRKFNVSHARAVSSLEKAGVSLPNEEKLERQGR
jgi:hypothetical protein